MTPDVIVPFEVLRGDVVAPCNREERQRLRLRARSHRLLGAGEIVVGLEPHPVMSRDSEDLREHQRGFRRDGALAEHDLIDAARRDSHAKRQSVLADFERLHELREQDLARVHEPVADARSYEGRTGPHGKQTPKRLPAMTADEDYLSRRLRTSYRHTPLATETFRLSTVPIIGSDTSRSQLSLVRRRRPSPSAPITIPRAPSSFSW